MRLILFDVDGTLLDSQTHIFRTMTEAFDALGAPPPAMEDVRRVIGLALETAIARIAPDLSAQDVAAASQAYRRAAAEARAAGGGEAASPLFPGARDALARLAQTEALLGVATGKGRPGLECALEAHRLRPFFVTTQTGSDAPGKPNPEMVLRALSETGAEARDTVVVGDSPYDMQMALNAGARALGVAWGCHEAQTLIDAGAERVLQAFEEMEGALDGLWGAGWRGSAG